MKRTLWIAAFVVMGVTLGVAIGHVTAQQKAPPPPARIAVVDLGRLFRSYQKSTDYLKEKNDEMQRLVNEDEARGQAIEKAKNVLQNLKTGSVEYDKKVDEITKLSIEHQVWKNTQADLQQRTTLRRTKEMYDEMVKVATAVAQRGGCNMVMAKEPADISIRTVEEFLDQLGQRKILYAADTLDITDDVLQQLNEMYTGKK